MKVKVYALVRPYATISGDEACPENFQIFASIFTAMAAKEKLDGYWEQHDFEIEVPDELGEMFLYKEDSQ